MITALPQDYYLQNFVEMVDHVVDGYADLLSSSEQEFHHTFHQLDEDAKKLLVRMVTRKGELFRSSKLQYREITNTEKAAQCLSQKGLIGLNQEKDIHAVVGLYSRNDWLSILKHMNHDVSGLKKLKRGDLNDQLVKILTNLTFPELPDEIYTLRNAETYEVFKLLFFGNLQQDLTEWVLRDLGLYRFEEYTIDANTRLFKTRAQVERHLEFHYSLQSLEEVLMGDDESLVKFYEGLPSEVNDDPTYNRRLYRVKYHIARQLERLNRLEKSEEIYANIPTAYARERLARVLAKQENVSQCLATLKTIVSSPYSEAEAIFASEFGHRFAKKHDENWPKPEKYSPPTTSVQIPHCEIVELGVVKHMSGEGECFYVENSIFCSAFGLQYWDVLFAPCTGAFTHSFQTQPHDLYEHTFIDNRRTVFDESQKRLESLAAFRECVLDRWHQKHGIASPFIYWSAIDKTVLEKSLDTIPLLHWQAIFARILADLKENRNGFPDLILFSSSGGYELIEVKGPGDRLQKNQLRWMHYFHQHNIPHRVVNVEWIK